jgi:hypothetical protein
MQSKSTAEADLSAYFHSGDYGHANAVSELVLERLPNGDYAYLKPEDDEPRYTVTDSGRRALRMAEMFGTNG